MADKRYGVIRTDNMVGTKNGTYLVSLRYTADIDNGCILAVGGYEEGSREVRVATAPATEELGGLAICASPEVVKDVTSHEIYDFYNKAGAVIRAYRFHANDIFSVTQECLADTTAPAVGQFATIAGTKIKLLASVTAEVVIGKVIAVETETNGNVFVVIEVA